MPATTNDAMKDGPPLSLKLDEQITSATHRMAPSTCTLVEASELHSSPRSPSAGQCRSFPLSKPHRCARSPLRSQTQLRRCAGQVVRYVDIVKRIYASQGVLALERAMLSLRRCRCPFRRLRKALGERPLPQPNNSLRLASVPRLRHVRPESRNASSRTERGRCGLS